MLRRPNGLVCSSLLLILVPLGLSLAAQTGREVARYALASVVVIFAQNEKGKAFALGSGFFVADGIIATNYHVIQGAPRLSAKIVGQRGLYPISRVLMTDRTRDLAFLAVTGVKASALTLGDDTRVAPGDEVYVIGNPQGLEGTFSKGVISGIRSINGKRYLQITAPISPGSSGGPVLNASGEVIGVAVGSLRTGQNLNFAIPISYLSSLLSSAEQTTNRFNVNPKDLPNEKKTSQTDSTKQPARVPSNYEVKEIAERISEVRKHKDSADAHFKLAETYRRWTFHKVESIQSYKRAIEIDPTHPETFYGLAEVYMTRLPSRRVDPGELANQAAMAAEAYKQAIRLKPDYFEAHLGLARAYSSLDRFDDAIEACKIALSIKPASPEALNELGSDYFITESYSDAIETYQRSFEIDPTDYRVLYDIGRIYLEQKQYLDAIKMYQRGIRAAESGSVTFDEYYNLCEAYEAAGRTGTGIAYFNVLIAETKERIAKLSPDPKVRSQEFVQQADMKSKLAWLYRSLGSLYARLREKASALEQYKALKALGSDWLVQTLANELFEEIYK